MSQHLMAAIRAVHQELRTEVADTPDLVQEAIGSRHLVVCAERGIEPPADGLKADANNTRSKYVLLRRRRGNEVIGTARLVLGDARRGAGGFPMAAISGPAVFDGLPLASSAEISRFSLCRVRPGLSPEVTSLSRLALIRGLVELTRRAGVTHWCAIMERTFIRILRSSGIHFTPVGPTVEYHGFRQPAVCHVGDMLARMRRDQPDIWRYVTADGWLARHMA